MKTKKSLNFLVHSLLAISLSEILVSSSSNDYLLNIDLEFNQTNVVLPSIKSEVSHQNNLSDRRIFRCLTHHTPKRDHPLVRDGGHILFNTKRDESPIIKNSGIRGSPFVRHERRSLFSSEKYEKHDIQNDTIQNIPFVTREGNFILNKEQEENPGGVKNDSLHLFTPQKEKSRARKRKLHQQKTSPQRKRQACVHVAIASGYVVLFTVIIILLRKKLYSIMKLIIFRGRRNTQNIKVVLKNRQFLGPKRYRYSELKKMTKNFRDKLGQGGYGSVYKGMLINDHAVAVKILSRSKDNDQDFINEVTTIGTTNHVNIITLLGYCFEGSKRALVYDFMPYGSLDRFIYANKSTEENKLKMKSLYQISLGVARGLEYLHSGCSTHILHLDIKPHNILLDQDLHPKISDFGLAKISDTKENFSSMNGARGTRGYIAPELCCRILGAVSHKSDVYSYGMMMLEMVGGRKNLEPEIENTSQIYYPHWIYKHLKQQEMVDLEQADESELARKMIMVGMWCIAADPGLRPSMREVVEMLEGRVDNLQFPPNPFINASSVTVPSSS